MLPTPFIASFIGRAHEGELHEADFRKRSAAWAHWAVQSLIEMTGTSHRSYAAIVLAGRFYEPHQSAAPSVRPHLEIPGRVLLAPCPEFPDRLALMGNGLSFQWWLYGEVMAVKSALFSPYPGPIDTVSAVLQAHRSSLRAALDVLTEQLAPQWRTIEGLLVSAPDGLRQEATGDFTQEEVEDFFPGAKGLGMHVVYDPKLREGAKQWASRRLGVWHLRCGSTEQMSSLGVITPRLTVNSLFYDVLFSPATESPAALLVRGLVLRRLIGTHLAPVEDLRVGPPEEDRSHAGPHLRSIVAQPGAKIPSASVAAAVLFLQTYPDEVAAWQALAGWAERTKSLLTVSEAGFKACHINAARYLRRAEDPSRDDVDCLLPLAWDARSRVVRITFSR